MAFPAQSSRTAAVLTMKNTFLDVPEDSVRVRSALLRRAKTEPVLRSQVEEYVPGAYAASVTSTTLEELLESWKSTKSPLKGNVSGDLLSLGSTWSGGSAASSRSSSPERTWLHAGAGAGKPQPWRPAAVVATESSEPPRFSSSSTEAAGKAPTTLLLRNLPNNYTRGMFLTMLDREGFAGLYDFVYLPMDFRRHAGLGYAFVNLADAAVVPLFWKTFDGFSRWVIPTAKVCAVSWSSPHQGLEAHVRRYRNSPVMHPNVPDTFRPVLFVNGQRVPFPPPTKEIKPPMRQSR